MDRYAVVGNPVAHSLSPRIHGLFASQTGQHMTYERLLAPLDGFAAAVERFFEEGGKGINVTVPFKGEAAAWVSALDSEAAAAGAVNTVALALDGFPPSAIRRQADAGARLPTLGFNTDGTGLVRDLRDNHGVVLRGARTLILGAGGAVRGVVRPLLKEKPETLVIANRSPVKAEQLARSLEQEGLPGLMGVEVRGIGLDALKDGGYDVVVSGTSAGLTDAQIELPGSVVRGAFCYDMIYGTETAFCRWCAAHGASRVEDGIGMLVEQAAKAFEIWRGVAPLTGPVLALLRRERSSVARESAP